MHCWLQFQTSSLGCSKNEECTVEMNVTTVICLKTVPRYFISPGNALKPVGSLLKPDDKNIYSSTAVKKESESIKTVNNTLYMTYCRSYHRNIRVCSLIFIVSGERLKQRKGRLFFPLKICTKV